MSLSNKILYFVMGAIFAGTIGWSLYRPAVADFPSTVERKVDVLSTREVARMEKDIASLEKSIQEDNDFLTTKYTAATGKGSWSSAYAQRKNDIEQNLPGKEKRVQELKAQLETLRM